MNTLIIVCALICLISIAVIVATKICGTVAVKDFLTSNKFKATIGLIAAIVMYFTPDHIDQIITYALTFLGIPVLVIEQGKK